MLPCGQKREGRMHWEVTKAIIYAKATVPMSHLVQAAPPGHALLLVGTIALGCVRWHVVQIACRVALLHRNESIRPLF